ncbi:MAG: lysylphosphatidylglycerol synthase transmembrane domain-containing protein [bacterium]
MSMLKDPKVWVGLIFSGIGFYYFNNQVQEYTTWGEVFHTALTVSYILFLPSILLNFVSIYFRAVRWRSFLGPPPEPTKRLFGLLCVCFMGNSLLPARAGELIRTFLLARTGRRRFTEVLATVVVERVFDFAGILVALGVILVLAPFPMNESGTLATIIQIGGKVSLIFVVVVVGALLVLTYFPQWTYRVVSLMVRPFPEEIWGWPFRRRILEMTVSFERGLSTFRRPASFLWTSFLTLLVWLLLAWSEYVMIQAFGLAGTISFMGGILVMVAICLVVALPSAPGYVGIYHVAAQAVLIELYHVPVEKASAFAIVLWLSQIAPLIIAGLISLNRMNITFREIVHVQEETPDDESS